MFRTNYLLCLLAFLIPFSIVAQPSNDLCTNATVLLCGSNLIGESTVGSTDIDLTVGCSIGIGIWYKFSPTTTQTIDVAISNVSFAYEFGISTSTDCTTFTNLDCINSSGSDQNFIFEAFAGTDYYIMIGDRDSDGTDEGTFDISLACYSPPVNNLCAGASVLSCGSNLVGETTVGSTDIENAVGCLIGVGTWYTFTPLVTETVDVSVSNATFDYRYGIASSSDCISFNNIDCSNSSSADKTLIFEAIAGIEYYIFIGDSNISGTDYGSFDISITCITPPVNNLCSGASVLSCGSNLIGESTVGSTDIENAVGCLIGVGVWYTFSPLISETVDVSVSNATFDYRYGIASSTDCLSFNTIDCSPSSSSDKTLVFDAIAGVDYYIFIGDSNLSGIDYGSFDISITCITPAPNNFCSDATEISCGSNLIGESTVGSTDIENAVGCLIGVGTWYTFTPLVTETVDISISNATFDYRYGISSSADCVSFSNEECSSSSSSDKTLLFDAVAGVDYYIFIGDSNLSGTDYGSFDISVTCSTTPGNNDCANATALLCGDNILEETTEGSTDNGDATGCLTGIGVWYTFAAFGFGTATLTISPESSYRPKISVSTSDDCMSFTNILCQTGAIGEPETISFPFLDGETYYIYIGDPVNSGFTAGDFDIDFQCDFCVEDFAGANQLTGTQSITIDFETNGAIESDQNLLTGIQVDYDSYEEVTLLPNFIIPIGTIFNAFIDGCGGIQ